MSTTTKVFVTGDRSIPKGMRTAVAAQALAVLAANANSQDATLELYTGDSDGFEAGVRNFAQGLGLTVHVIASKLDADTGKPDWNERHARVDQLVDRVVMFHGDPLASSIGASLMATIPAEKLVIA